MIKATKRLISLFLCTVLILGTLSVGALAEETSATPDDSQELANQQEIPEEDGDDTADPDATDPQDDTKDDTKDDTGDGDDTAGADAEEPDNLPRASAAGARVDVGEGTVVIEAEDYASINGASVVSNGSSSGGAHLAIGAGSGATYDIDVSEAGYYDLSLTMKSGQSNVAVQFKVDGRIKRAVSNPGNSFVACSFVYWLDAGAQTLEITSYEKGWDLDKIAITRQSGAYPVSASDSTLIEAEDFVETQGTPKILLSNESSGWGYLGDFYEGNAASYRIDVEQAGLYLVWVRAGAPNAGAFRVEGSTSQAQGNFSATGGWQAYQETSVVLSLEAGEQTLTLTNTMNTWNFDSIRLAHQGDSLNVTAFGHVGASNGDASLAVDGDDDTAWLAGEGDYILVRFENAFELRTVEYNMQNVAEATLLLGDGSSAELDPAQTQVAVNANTYWAMIRIDRVSDLSKPAELSGLALRAQSIEPGSGIDYALRGYTRNAHHWESMLDAVGGVALKDNQLRMLWSYRVEIDEIVLGALPAGQTSLQGTLSLEGGEALEVDVPVQNGMAVIALEEHAPVQLLELDVEGLDGDPWPVLPVVQVFASGTEDLDEAEHDYDNAYLTLRWHSEYMIEKDGKACYTYEATANSLPEARWSVKSAGGGSYTIQNVASGRYLALLSDSQEVHLVDSAEGDNARWLISANSGYHNIDNKQYPTRRLNIEKTYGVSDEVWATDDTNSNYHSAMFRFVNVLEPIERSYSINEYTITGTDGTATAYGDKRIVTNAYGVQGEWNLSTDLSHLPSIRSGNAIADATYNLSLEESVKSIYIQNGQPVFNTGTNWGKVWTRDTAMAIEYSLGWLYPDVSENCLYLKIIDDINVFEQDTGTGGSYPNSVDRIISMLAVWDVYLTNGNTQLLEDMYTTASNTLEQDFHVVYNADIGLFKGETGGLDHRSKTYPDWMDEEFPDSIVNITDSYSSIVNIIYAETMNILSQSAQILGKGQDEAEYWAGQRDKLIETINEKFWMEDRGMYASFLYPEYMGYPMADKVDVISNGYAILFDVADSEQAASILENYPMVVYGAPTVWPQKTGKQYSAVYHNRGVWPGWEPVMMLAALKEGHYETADHIWRSCVRTAAVMRTNKEVVNFETGEGIASNQQLWSVAGTISGYYRVLFGMELKQDGVHFTPYVPEWMEGPFAMDNFTYRDATLSLRLSGEGDTLVSMRVNGEEQPLDYVLPTDASGDYLIEMVVEDSGNRSTPNITELSWVYCPTLPVLNYDPDTHSLSWTELADHRYLLWDGAEYIDVTGRSSYPVADSGYAVYSLVSVSSDGITSEMAKPLTFNDDENIVTVSARDGQAVYGDSLNLVTVAGRQLVQDNWGGNKWLNTTGVKFTVTVPKDGNYLVSGIYHNNGDATTTTNCAIRSLYIDGEDVGTMIFPLSNHNLDTSIRLKVELSAGTHEVMVFYDRDNWYDHNMNTTRNNVSYDTFSFEYIGDFGEEKPPAESISLSVAALNSMRKNATLQVSASVLPSGANQRVVWSSSNENVLTIDQNGLVTAHKVGSAIITATSADGTVTKMATIRVSA